MQRQKLKRGARVQVPWGFDTRNGRIVEVWGDPPTHVRVDVELAGPDHPEDIVRVLLGADIVEVAQPA